MIEVNFLQYAKRGSEHNQRTMNITKTPVLLLATLLATALVRGAETQPLDEHLEPFRPFLGKTWRGVFKNSKPDKPTVDVARWERALNGKAIRVLHSINDGSYGGESIIRWDKTSKQIVYHYYTTAGFMTSGTMIATDGKLVGLEKVSGDANGVTEVRSTTQLRADGTMLVKAEYLKDGQPAGGRETLYKEDPKAEVKFK
jgi:hypothetical protein